jgi:hypothetical protein
MRVNGASNEGDGRKEEDSTIHGVKTSGA